MTFGINTFLFQSPFTTESFYLFERFKSWGFDSVEVAIEDAAHISAADFRRALTNHGLVAATAAAATGPGRDLRGSRSEQQTSLDYLMGAMDLMAEVSIPMIVGPVYSSVGRAEVRDEDDRRREWDLVVRHLGTLCAYAKERNIRIALEPLNRYETDFINTAQQALDMIADVGSDALTILLDTYHMNIEEKDPAAAIRAAGRKLGAFHACGCDRGTPGKDHINWTAIASALRETGYDGSVVIESFTTDVKVIAKAASIWRKFETSQESIATDGLAFLHSILK